MERGEVYIVKSRYTVGSEIAKARPAVIVSNDLLNATAEVVEVVYLTTKPKKDLPTHVSIQATGVRSTALCEQIDSVSLQLVCGRVGVCSEEEMAAVDRALMCSLGVTTEPRDAALSKGVAEGTLDLYIRATRALAERDAYKEILDRILDGGGCTDE